MVAGAPSEILTGMSGLEPWFGNGVKAYQVALTLRQGWEPLVQAAGLGRTWGLEGKPWVLTLPVPGSEWLCTQQLCEEGRAFPSALSDSVTEALQLLQIHREEALRPKIFYTFLTKK